LSSESQAVKLEDCNLESRRTWLSLTGSILVLGLWLSACSEDPEAPFTRPPVRVAISPDEIPALCAGEQTRLQVSVTGTNATAVQWRSTVPATANVDSTGLVRAISAGDTWIVATAAADSAARDSVSITVTPVVLFYDAPTVWLGAMTTHNSSAPIDTANVSGARLLARLVRPCPPERSNRLQLRRDPGTRNNAVYCEYGRVESGGTTPVPERGGDNAGGACAVQWCHHGGFDGNEIYD
jgi:hypothetical protein